MGMTIDNSIRLLEDYLKWQKFHEMSGSGIDEATTKLLEVAKKYQKIQEIIRADFEEYHPLDRNPYKLHLIEKVLEDGND